MIQHNTYSNIPMIDQATRLRDLVERNTSGGAGPAPEGPRVVLMVGGRASVGTTSLARLLGHSLRERGWQAKVIETDHGAPENSPDTSLLQSGTGVPAEVLLVDAGSGPNETFRRWQARASLIVIVTTPEQEAIMDTYVTIKAGVDRQLHREVAVLFTLADGAEPPAEVHRRLDGSCRRFLDISVAFAGEFPDSPGIAEATLWPMPLEHSLAAATPLTDHARGALERTTAWLENRLRAPVAA